MKKQEIDRQKQSEAIKTGYRVIRIDYTELTRTTEQMAQLIYYCVEALQNNPWTYVATNPHLYTWLAGPSTTVSSPAGSPATASSPAGSPTE